MSKAGIIGAVVIVGVGVAGGGGYYYISQQAEQQFQDKIKLIKNSFPGSTLTYEKHKINVFSKEATLDKVVFKDKNGSVYTADKVDATLGSENSLSKLSIDKFGLQDGVDDLTIAHIDGTDLSVGVGAIVLEEGKVKKIFPSKFSFGLLNIQNLELSEGSSLKFKIDSYQLKNYGLGKKTDMVVNGISSTDRNIEFKLASLKFIQANQADIAQKQEVFVENRDNFRSVDQMVKEIFQNFSEIQFGLLSFDDLQFKTKYSGILKINHYEFNDFGLGKKSSQILKEFVVSDFDRSNKNSIFKIASVENEGIDWAKLIQSMKSIQFGNFEKMITSFSQWPMNYVKQAGDIQSKTKIAGLQVSVPDMSISLDSLTDNSQFNTQGNGDEAYDLVGLKFSLPVNSHNDFVQTLRQIGYDKIAVSGKFRTQYQKDTGLLTLSLDNLSFVDIGKINAVLKVNLPYELFATFSIKPQLALMNPAVKYSAFTMTVQNTGLYEALIKRGMEKSSISKEELEQNFISSAKENMGVLKKINQSLGDDIIKVAETFMKDPKKTEIKLTSIPTTPISASEIFEKNEQAIFDILNVKINTAPIQ